MSVEKGIYDLRFTIAELYRPGGEGGGGGSAFFFYL
jgi:hypothetical protein